MRIGILSSNHKVNDDRIFYKEALSFKKITEDITLIIPHSRSEVINGINVIAIKGKTSSFTRFKTIFQLIGKSFKFQFDIIICHEPDSLLVGWVYKLVHKCNLIYDSHELYSKYFPQHFKYKLVKKTIELTIRLFEKIVCRKVNTIITVSDSIKNYFNSLGFNNVVVIYNVPKIEIFEQKELKTDKKEDELWICHEGNINFNRGLKQLLEIINIMKKEIKVKLNIIGEIEEREKKWFNQYLRENVLNEIVNVTGWLDYKKVGNYIKQNDIGIILFQPIPNNIVGLPNKLFNYMAFGLPIVVPNFPDMKTIISEYKCGITVNPTNQEEVAKKILSLFSDKSLLSQMQLNSKNAFEKVFNWGNMEYKLFELIKIKVTSKSS